MGRKTKTDPTGQAPTRRRGQRGMLRRIGQAERAVKRLFRAIPRKRRAVTPLSNAKTIPVYDYQITAGELEQLERQIRDAVADEIVETRFDRMPPNWWWQEPIEQAYRSGTAEEVVEFNQLVTAELVRTRTMRGLQTQRLEVGAVLRSPEYVQALDRIYVRNFGDVKTLSDKAAAEAVGVINRGIAAKQPPSKITEDIAGRFDVTRSAAKRLVDTNVNQAYNDARLDASDIAAEQTGMRAGVLHLSALIPTTRGGHAARHGNAYTTAQQRQWWDEGANRINCKCSTRTVLIDRAGKPIDLELQEEIRAERELFDEES